MCAQLPLIVLATVLRLGYGDGPAGSADWKKVSYRGRTSYSVERDSSRRAWLRAEARGQNETLGQWERSPYASGIKVITLQNGPSGGPWRAERRDLGADLRAAFGPEQRTVLAIGVLCDADNTGNVAASEIGELRLTWADAGRTEPPGRDGRQRHKHFVTATTRSLMAPRGIPDLLNLNEPVGYHYWVFRLSCG